MKVILPSLCHFLLKLNEMCSVLFPSDPHAPVYVKKTNPGPISGFVLFEDFTRPDCDVKLQEHAAVSFASFQIIGKMTL